MRWCLSWVLLLSLWSLVLTVESSSRLSVKRPLLIVPGFGTTALYATNSATHERRLVFPPEGNGEVVDPLLLCRLSLRRLQAHNDTLGLSASAASVYACETGVEGTSVAPSESWSGFDGNFVDLPGYNISPLISFFSSSLGYARGSSLFGFPYDWRQSHLSAARSLVAFVEARNLSSFDVLSHSMGFSVLQTALSYFPSFAARVHQFLVVAAPCEGLGGVWPLMLLETPEALRDVYLGSPSVYELIARTQNRMQTLPSSTFSSGLCYQHGGLQTNAISFADLNQLTGQALADNTVAYADHPTVLQPLPFNQTVLQWAFHKDQTLSAVTMPHAHVIFGALVDVPTLARFERDLGEPPVFSLLLSSPVRAVTVDSGDGVLLADSTSCPTAVPLAATRTGFPELSHNALIADEKALHLFEKYLGCHCVWDGEWLITIEGSIQELIRLTFHPQTLTVTSESYDLTGRITSGNTLNGTLVGSYGNATFGWEIAPNCSFWTGYWQYDWSVPYHWHATLVSSNYTEPPQGDDSPPAPTLPSGAFVGASGTPWVIAFSFSLAIIATVATVSVIIIRRRGYLFKPPDLTNSYESAPFDDFDGHQQAEDGDRDGDDGDRFGDDVPFREEIDHHQS